MIYSTFISTDDLDKHLEEKDWVLFDCRFWLQEPQKGQSDYQQAHIPGAIYLHLDEDLSGPIIPGKTGRHPFPDPDRFSQKLGEWGVNNHSQIIAYDQLNGAIAARLWGLMRWLGHQKVAVLEGGWEGWIHSGRPVSNQVPDPTPETYLPNPLEEFLVNTADIASNLGQGEDLLVDSRTPERFRGENEPIDPVAGHIPGAVSFPYTGNVAEDGTLRPNEELRKRINSILGSHPPENMIFYCGSGVTSIHNLIVFEHLGLGLPKLYPGSWSAWIADRKRPIETWNED